MNGRFVASFAVVCVLLAGDGCAYARGGRYTPSDADLKDFEGIIVRIDSNERSLTLSQPHDQNIAAVVVSFCDTTHFWVDGEPASDSSLKLGMDAEVEMRGRKMTRLIACSSR